MATGHYHWRGNDLVLLCHVQPGASASEWHGMHGDRIKVRIKAPPAEGRANRELLRFIAEQFGVSMAQVELLAGASGRAKTIVIAAPRQFPPGALVSGPAGAA